MITVYRKADDHLASFRRGRGGLAVGGGAESVGGGLHLHRLRRDHGVLHHHELSHE